MHVCYLFIIFKKNINDLNNIKTKFLIADDDVDDKNMFCEALSKIDDAMKCFSVENGREVLEFLSGPEITKPDIIFLDINMPIMNGWDCLKKLKQSPDFKSIPTIMYSTSSAKRDIELAYSLGAILFVTKPEDFHELCKILQIVASNPQGSLLTNLKGFENVKVA
jgi:CheY-like chemotaxis protein